jgi:GT2 family glycosyltransferase
VRSRRILQITGYGEMIAGYQADVTCFAKTLVGSNMSVSREVQRRVGWFDTNFTGTSLFEEQDFSARLRRLGYYILFTNKTTVQHVPQPNGNDDLKRSQPALYYHWFHHNEIVYFLKNYSRFNLVCVIPFCLLRSIKQSILRRLSLGDAVYMFSGVFEGFKTYYTALS